LRGRRRHGSCPVAIVVPDDPSNRGTMSDKSPRQSESKKSGKSLKEKRVEKKAKQSTKRSIG